MRSSKFTCITHVLCALSLSLAAFGQTAASAPPALSSDTKLAIRNAQHKRDGILKQQSDLSLQIADLQKRIGDESTRLAGLLKTADADYKTATDAVCPKDFKLDEESLTCTAVPATAASTSAPAPSPKPPGSPGATAPPTQQAKK